MNKKQAEEDAHVAMLNEEQSQSSFERDKVET